MGGYKLELLVCALEVSEFVRCDASGEVRCRRFIKKVDNKIKPSQGRCWIACFKLHFTKIKKRI